jgi:hypothetical protein
VKRGRHRRDIADIQKGEAGWSLLRGATRDDAQRGNNIGEIEQTYRKTRQTGVCSEATPEATCREGRTWLIPTRSKQERQDR